MVKDIVIIKKEFNGDKILNFHYSLIFKIIKMTKKEVTQLSYEITGLAIKVHKTLGPGLLESVYEKCLNYELTKNG